MVKQKILFSIIIPVYNVEKYLEQCLQSVISQTYTNFEVILINDGSTDKSKKICDKYTLDDTRFKLIDIKNKGVSNARNLGIEKSRGEYILFLDSDDYIELDALEKIYNVVNSNDYDIVLYRLVREINNKKIIDIDMDRYMNKAYSTKEEIKDLMPYLIKKEIINSPIKVYRNKLIKFNNIKFDTKLDLGEDLLFNMECILSSNNIYIMNDILYHYMIRNEDSLTNKFMSDKYNKLMYVNGKIWNLVKTKYKNNEFKLQEALLYIRLKNIYSCFLDIHSKKCGLSYKQKLKYIDYIKDNEIRHKFSLIKDIKFKVLAIVLKLNSKLVIYNFSKVLYIITKL